MYYSGAALIENKDNRFYELEKCVTKADDCFVADYTHIHGYSSRRRHIYDQETHYLYA